MKNLENATVESIEQLTDAVRKIAPNAWEITVRHQYIESSVDIVTCLAMLAATVYTSLRTYSWYRKDCDFDKVPVLAVVIVISGFIGLFSVATVAQSVTVLLNPEFHAMQELAGMLIK